MTPGWFQITLKLVLWRDGRYLALRDSFSGAGDLPGGRIGQAELFDLSGALSRELAEELGNEIQTRISAEAVCIFPHHVAKDDAPAVAVVFEGALLSGEPRLSDEHTEMFWLTPRDDPSPLFSGTMLDGLKKYLHKKKIEADES